MNLLIFIHSLHSGGAERVTVNLANNWALRGWQITIVTLASRDLDFYDLHPSVRRIAMDLASESSTPVFGIVNNLKRLKDLRRILCEVGPDISLGMMSTANVLLFLASIGLPSIKVIASERIYPPAWQLGIFWEQLRSWTYPWVDRVILQTSKGVRWLGQEIPKARGLVIPNPILYPLPISKPIVPPEKWVAPNRKLLLAVGRLTDQKGFDLLLLAFAELESTHPEWDLVILSEGPRRFELEQQAQALGLGAHLHLPGRVGNVGDWYRRADIFVMSSRFEGFPNTLGEAMAHGCATVSFDCDTGPRDLIRHGVDGLLVPAGDVAALAVALHSLMSDDALREQYAKRSIEVRERFSLKRITEMWEQLFYEVKR